MLDGLGKFDNDTTEYPGLCTHIALNIDDKNINNEATTHSECMTSSFNYLPSLGLKGRFCPCIRHLTTQKTENLQQAHYIDNQKENETIVDCDTHLVELSNVDFE